MRGMLDHMAFGSQAVRVGSVRGGVSLAVFFLLAMVFLALTMGRYVNPYDEGLILYGTTLVMDGAIPHRDFYVIYGPGQFYLLAALFKIFGVSVLVERAYDLVVRAIIALLVLIVVNQVAPRVQALIAAAACLVYLAFFQAYGSAMYPALVAVLASAAFLNPALARPAFAPGLFAAGVCAGVAVLMRYDVGIGIAGAECAVLCVHAWFERVDTAQGIGAAIRALLWFGLGVAIVVVPVAVAFVMLGVIPDLISQFAIYTPAYVKMRSLPFPGLSMLRENPAKLSVYLPLLMCLAALQTVFVIARQKRNNVGIREPAGPWQTSRAALQYMLLLLVALTLVLFAKGIVRTAMEMALITTLALAGALAQPITGRGKIGLGISALAILGTILFGVSCLRPEAYRALSNIAWAKDPASWSLPANGVPPELGSCRLPADLERLACFRLPLETVETIRYVQQHTAPGDPVFVGLSRHDLFYANDITLYFSMNRRAATKWYEFDSGLTTLAPLQRVIVGELQRAKPVLVVLESTWENMREPNASAISSGVTILDDYLRQTFEPVATFGPYTVLRVRTAERL